MRLEGKVAVITGGASGIGRETAVTLAREGCNVAIIDVAEGRDAVKEIESLGRKAVAFKVNVRHSKEVNGAIQKVVDEFGKIDILANCAGVARRKEIVNMTDEDWNEVLEINLNGTFYCTRAVLPVMMKRRHGRIICISSIVGTAWGWENAAHYTASKGGVVGFIYSLALEGAKYNITANAIAPGVIDTPLSRSKYGSLSDEQGEKATLKVVPIKRIGMPRDIANAVLFLATDEASYITGQVIHINGGITLGTDWGN